MGEGIITEKNKTRTAKKCKGDELSLRFPDGGVFILVLTANSRLFCAIVNNKPMRVSSLGRGEKRSTHTG